MLEFTKLIQLIWNTEVIPNDWRIVLLMMLHKKKSPRKTDNYRTLGIVGPFVKVYTTILSMRMYPYYHNNVSPEQFSNKIGNGTLEAMINTQRIIEDCISLNRKIYLILVDLKKAFDSLEREITWKILEYYGIPHKILKLIEDLYEKNENWMYVDGDYGDQKVHIERGVRQGCILSSMIFCIMFDYVVRKSLQRTVGIKYEYEDYMNYHQGNESCQINKVIYADDIIIIAQNVTEVENILMSLDSMTKSCGMQISYEKTEILYINSPEHKRIKNEHVLINGKNVKYVNKVTHLGRIIDNGLSNTERHKENVVNRINKARGSFMKYFHSVWRNTYIKIDLKMKLYDSLVMSVLMYSMDTVFYKKTYCDQMKFFTVGCYKKILGIHRDVEISEEHLVEILGVDTVKDRWMKRRIQAYSHISRLPYKNPARIVLLGKMSWKSSKRQRKFFNVKRTMMKDINKYLNESTYCNLCDRKIRSTFYTST